MPSKVNKSEEEWREILTPEQFHVTRKHGTEQAFSGEYDKHGDPTYTAGEMRFTSVARFTGQQAPAVILVDVDLSPGEACEQRRRTAFIGMTRATLRLDVVNIPASPNEGR